MTSTTFALPYLVLAATLLKALLVQAEVAAPSCGRCGLPRERRALGDRICGCGQV
jgi:hypothetical protein